MSNSKLSRRDFLKAAAASGAGLAAAGVFPVLAQDEEQPLPEGVAGTLTVVHRTEYFEQAQTIFRDTVEAFAAENGIAIDASTANPESFGDFIGKMQAAVAAGNPPDFAYQSSNLSIQQMHLLGLLEDVSAVVEEAVSRHGAIMQGTNAEEVGIQDGAWRGIPFTANTTGRFIRSDKLEEVGILPDDLVTYDDRREAALAMSTDDFWGWGLTPNQSGDGHGLLVSVIHSFGGHYTDETGTVVEFDSPETLAAVEWLTETYTSDTYAPMLPPGILSWTDISNNEAYLADTIGYTHNAFSVYAQAKRDENPVFPVTRLLLAPEPVNENAPDQNGGGIGGWHFIFTGAPNIDLAKELSLSLISPENFTPMSSVAGGLLMPAYENLWTDELLAADPNFAIILQQVSVEDPYIGNSWPAEPNAAIDAIRAAAIPEQMIANITAGRMNPQEAVTDAHNKIVDIFEEGGIMQP